MRMARLNSGVPGKRRKVLNSSEPLEVESSAAQYFAFGPFVLDTRNGMLLREGTPVTLGRRSLLLLQTLVKAPGEIFSKTALMEAAWPDAAVEESNLSVQIATLRKLLGRQADGREWITTIARVGYRFVGNVNVLDAIHGSGQMAALPERPSIAVLPFTNVSGDEEQAYLADGVTEDIIIALTRFRWFRVIGRNSSFVYKGSLVSSRQVAQELGVGYVLEGSVRRSGDRIRVSVQLIDAASDRQIWTERYHMELTEAFALQDAVAEKVAGAIEPELLRTDSLPKLTRHTGNVTAWNLVRQGTWNFHHLGRQTHLTARECFREACMLDPELADAHAWLGRVNAGIVAYGWSEDPSLDIREGVEAALTAVRLDEKNPYAHYALAICSCYANAPEQGVLAAEKAIEISPSFALGHLVLGMGHLFREGADEAIPSLEHGLALNAYDPQNFVWLNLLALACLFTDQANEALLAATRARKIRPSWRPILETLVCCHVSLGRLPEARANLQELQQMEKLPGDALQPLRSRSPHWAQMIADWMKSAERGAGP